MARSFMLLRPSRPAIMAGIITFSRAVNSGMSWWNWNTKPRCSQRKRANAEPRRASTSLPAMRSVPLSGRARVPAICSRVVLPAPLGPTMLTTSPLAMCRSMPFSTSSCPKDFLRFCISIISIFVVKKMANVCQGGHCAFHNVGCTRQFEQTQLLSFALHFSQP